MGQVRSNCFSKAWSCNRRDPDGSCPIWNQLLQKIQFTLFCWRRNKQVAWFSLQCFCLLAGGFGENISGTSSAGQVGSTPSSRNGGSVRGLDPTSRPSTFKDWRSFSRLETGLTRSRVEQTPQEMQNYHLFCLWPSFELCAFSVVSNSQQGNHQPSLKPTRPGIKTSGFLFYIWEVEAEMDALNITWRWRRGGGNENSSSINRF